MGILRKFIVGLLAFIGLGTVAVLALLWGVVSMVASALPDDSAAEAPRDLLQQALGKKPHGKHSSDEDQILLLSLDQAGSESDHRSLLSALDGEDHISLHKTVDALHKAARDPSVKGLIATLSHSPRGMAQSQELLEALDAYRRSGKPAVLFTPSLAQMGTSTHPTIDYSVAAAFSEIWLQPSGMLPISGLALEAPFARKALESLGLSVELGQRWEFKTAMDGTTRQSMSDAQRSNYEKFLGSWKDQIVEGISTRRHLPREKVETVLSGPPLLAKDALEAGFVDHLGYWDEALASLKQKSGLNELTDFADYAQRVAAEKKANPHAAKIAYLQANGVIASKAEGAGSDAAETDRLAEAVRDAVNDAEIKAIVLRINSPGGSYVAADSLWREIERAKGRGLPVVASMGDMAASGGYFIAMPANKIVALPGTLTGSVGVFALKPVLAGSWDKLNISWETVSTSPYATMWSPNRAFSEAERAAFDRFLDAVYDDFTHKLADGRHLDAAAVDAVARGRIWTGKDAQTVGLVDELGGLETALRSAKELASLSPDAPVTLVPFPEPASPMEEFLEALSHGGVRMMVQSLADVPALRPFLAVLPSWAGNSAAPLLASGQPLVLLPPPAP